MHIGVIFAITAGLNLVLAGSCPHEENGLQKWSEKWKDGGPVYGDIVTIDKPVLLDVTDVTVTQIHIVGDGKLVLLDVKEEPDRKVTITADGILLKNNSALIIGGEGDCRFQNQVEILLTGTRTADRTKVDEETGEKFIGVQDNGWLQIYGQERKSFTRLTTTAFPWTASNEIVYSHKDSKQYFDKDKWNEGLAMYVFYDCNLQPKSYKVFDFAQNGNTQNEQEAVQAMMDALDDVEDGQIVSIAKQKSFVTTADLSPLYTKLEEMTGISKLGLRDVYEFDTYALVFQKGPDGAANEQLKPINGTDEVTARASIVVKLKYKDTKVVAISKTMLKDRSKSIVDFRILPLSVGFPTIKVDDDVSSWKPGDEIIITTTDYSPKHTEVRVIKEIRNSRTVILQDELEYRHFGKIENGVDMRAEVGLLTRNIVIRGVMERECIPENNENCGEFDHDTYGGHVKAIHGFGSIHIEGAEFKNMGQAKDIGHYPIHFHMCLDVSRKEAVVKSNSIHNTYLRCVTIHGTWGTDETHTGVKVLDNVAYDILGTCYFTEDGPEKFTVIDGNLAANIKRVQTNGFRADKDSPAAFWITNPVVWLTNNVVAGCEGQGIWYVFPDEPVGPSKNLVYAKGEAFRTPLWKFDNNKVHSVEKDGVRFDNILRGDRGQVDGRWRYRPLKDPKNDSSDLATTYIVRLTSYKNLRRNAWFLVAGKFILIQYSSAESRRGLQSARSTYNLFVKKSIFVGRSLENFEDDVDTKHRFGIVHYENPIFVSETWFTGFETTENYIGGALGFQFNKRMSEPFGSNTTDIRFGDVDRVDGTGVNRVFNGLTYAGLFGTSGPTHPTASFRNGDSSMLTCPGLDMHLRQVLMPYSYITTDKCKFRENWNATACEYNYGMIHLGGTGSDTVQVKRLNFENQNDVAYEDHTAEGQASNAYTVALGTGKYYYLFQYEGIAGLRNTVTFSGRGVERDDDVVIGICLPKNVNMDQVELRGFLPPSTVSSNTEWEATDSIEKVFQDDTMTLYYKDGRTLYVRLSSKLERDLSWEKYDTAHCPSNKCPSLTVKLLVPGDFEYEPCFNIPEGEANKLMTKDNMESLTCDLPAMERESDWGAGDTSRDVIPGSWGEWSPWSYCCGNQRTNRHRVCDNPPPTDGGTCPGNSFEDKKCPIGCPADGEFSDWSRWSDCFCDGIAEGSSGARTRTRQCENVANGGDFCSGPLEENEPCDGECA